MNGERLRVVATRTRIHNLSAYPDFFMACE
jgi:hypothetical protein